MTDYAKLADELERMAGPDTGPEEDYAYFYDNRSSLIAALRIAYQSESRPVAGTTADGVKVRMGDRVYAVDGLCEWRAWLDGEAMYLDNGNGFHRQPLSRHYSTLEAARKAKGDTDAETR